MSEDLGDCGIEDCGRPATRRTPWGLLCETHRKRMIPSRAGGKKLFESVAKREEFLRRWREVALEYAEADEDRDFDAAERKMLALLQGVLDDGTSELSRAASELSLARSLAIRRGFARARAAGTTLGRPLMFSREGAMAALAKAGSVKGAAQLLGCSGRTIYRLCQKDGVLARVLENNRGPKPTVPDRPQSTISPQGETDAPLQGKVEGRVQSQRGRADEEREAAEAGAGDRLPGAGRKA